MAGAAEGVIVYVDGDGRPRAGEVCCVVQRSADGRGGEICGGVMAFFAARSEAATRASDAK